jgi:hypothetical protein
MSQFFDNMTKEETFILLCDLKSQIKLLDLPPDSVSGTSIPTSAIPSSKNAIQRIIKWDCKREKKGQSLG